MAVEIGIFMPFAQILFPKLPSTVFSRVSYIFCFIYNILYFTYLYSFVCGKKMSACLSALPACLV